MGLSRAALFAKAGISRPGPKLRELTLAAFESYGQSQLGKGRFRSAFWGGMFPAGQHLHCGRKAMYDLMNLPETAPANPKLQATSESGKAAEDIIVRRWEAAGMTLGGSVEKGEQLRFQDPEHWISTALDSALDLRPNWHAVVPVDVKSKKDSIIEEMKFGQSEVDPVHRAQVISYCYVCRLHHKEAFGHTGLAPAEGGFVFYVSRDNPSNCYDFWIPYDEDEVEAALALLKEWRDSFIEGKLPPREKFWKWTEEPCKWCPVKKMCKQDMKDDVEDLSASCTIDYAKSVDPEYDFEAIQQKVIKRWEGK